MGARAVERIKTEEDRRAFLALLLKDVHALDTMLAESLFEKGWLHLGAEQEIALVAPDNLPAAVGPDLLQVIQDPHYTTEIARFNLEVNLDPVGLAPGCFGRMEKQLKALLDHGERSSRPSDVRFLLTGILPTISAFHLEREFMTREKRYMILDDEMRARRGKAFEIHIVGADELLAELDSVLFEGCNTSFQMHLQVPPEDYVRAYNWAQMISGPVLAASANSPLLFGKELWMETRIALFQQSIDTRVMTNVLRERHPRVQFGYRWLQHSVSELYKDHIARFPILMRRAVGNDPMEQLREGDMPKLDALNLHNGTIYTWNRPCYGVAENRAHLRIESRYLPSGPTVADEMANLAFWAGLMLGQPKEKYQFYRDTPFREARDNFFRAARNGLNTLMRWFGKERSTSEIILQDLLPIARDGLLSKGLKTEEIEQHLSVIRERVAKARTGAQWQVENYRRLVDFHPTGVALHELTEKMMENQQEQAPVHSWKDVIVRKTYPSGIGQHTVEEFMKVDLYSVQAEESLALVQAIMEWKKIRHMPVEDKEGILVGLVTATNLRRWEAEKNTWDSIPVRDRMVSRPFTAGPRLSLSEAASLMRTQGIGCLPVVKNEKLIGLITDTDLRRLGLL